MNPNAKGWVEVYLDSLIKNYIHKSEKQNHQELFYANISRTGFLYGFPHKLNLLQFPEINNWSKHEIVKVSFLETLVCTYFNKNNYTNLPDDFKTNFTNRLYSFFVNKKISSSLNIDQKDKIKLIETEINNKVSASGKIKDYLSSGAYQNGLLFVETIVFNQWLANSNISLNNTKTQIIKEVIKVIIAASSLDNTVNKKEESVIKFYIASSRLSKEIADEIINNTKDISDIDTKIFDSWLLKKVVLELACLVVLSDEIVENDEQKLLVDFTNMLNLTDEDLNASIISAGNFLYEHHDSIYYLNQSKLPFIGKALSNRMLKFVRKNKDMIIAEVIESKELVELLRKSTTQHLTKEERSKVNNQLIDIVKAMPAVAIFMIPGGSFLLPIILKVLPEELIYPSSFTNKKDADS